MRINNYKFIELISEIHQVGPVIEYGSLRVSNEQAAYNDLRKFFKKLKYKGCDKTKGNGVDTVDDLVNSSLATGSAGTLLCCETLEHIFEVHKAAKQLVRLLNKKGLLIVTIPSGDFPIHWMPDYWRMTPEALDKLFEKIPYRTVLFQGKLDSPHTVMGAFTFNQELHIRLRNHLSVNVHKIPGLTIGEKIYAWLDIMTYHKQRVEYDKQFGVDYKRFI